MNYKFLKLIPHIVLTFYLNGLSSQSNKVDSLKLNLSSAQLDTSKVMLVNELGIEFLSLNEYDSVIQYTSDAIILASKINFKQGHAALESTLGRAYYLKFKFTESLACYELALSIYQELNLKSNIGKSYLGLAQPQSVGGGGDARAEVGPQAAVVGEHFGLAQGGQEVLR